MAISTIGSAGINQAADTTLCTTSGNVGIGTSSPGAKLQVAAPNGGIIVSGGSGTATNLYLAANGNTAGTTSFDILQGGDSVGYVYNRANASLSFGTNNSERMRIDFSGRLGFPGAQSTYGAVTIYGTKNGWGGINFNSTAGTNIGTVMVSDGYGGFFNSADNAWLGYFTATSLVLGGGQTLTPTGSAPLYACRAWANFDGSATSPITPRASGNVSSVTRSATGTFTVSFTTAMPDANYAISLSLSGGANCAVISSQSTSSFVMVTENSTNGTNLNATINCIAVFR